MPLGEALDGGDSRARDGGRLTWQDRVAPQITGTRRDPDRTNLCREIEDARNTQSKGMSAGTSTDTGFPLTVKSTFIGGSRGNDTTEPAVGRFGF
jgi:hypothetical protein